VTQSDAKQLLLDDSLHPLVEMLDRATGLV
jgi:hypothetical protein